MRLPRMHFLLCTKRIRKGGDQEEPLFYSDSFFPAFLIHLFMSKSNGADSENSVHSVEKQSSDRINKMGKMGSESGTSNSVDSVHFVENPSSDRINKMNKMDSESGTSNSDHSVDSVQNPLPNSKKVFVAGKVHPDIRVPFREINLAPTKTMNGEIEVNEPVRVYDTSGPWGADDVDL